MVDLRAKTNAMLTYASVAEGNLHMFEASWKVYMSKGKSFPVKRAQGSLLDQCSMRKTCLVARATRKQQCPKPADLNLQIYKIVYGAEYDVVLEGSELREEGGGRF